MSLFPNRKFFRLVFLLVPAFFFLMLCSTCCKDEPLPDRSPHYAPQELKDYCYFLSGTYWIYKDSASGIEDSVYVTAAANSIDTLYDSEGRLQGIYEWFKVETVSSYDGYNYDYSFSATYSSFGCNPNVRQPCHRVKKIKVKPGDYVGEIWFFIYGFDIGTWIYSSPTYNDGITKVTVHFDSLNISNQWYNKVIEVNYSKDITNNEKTTNYLYAKNKGIIKKDFVSDNVTWILNRYYINQ